MRVMSTPRARARPGAVTLSLLACLALAVPCAGQASKDLRAMSLEEILNMTVSVASRSDEKLSEAPGVITVISKDELDRFGGLTLKDILERVPGLAPTGVYMTDRSMIAARGDQIQASSSHVLLLINGRPVREALEGGIKSEMLETFPSNVIEQIEVIRGPGSVLYGSNAFSAVINVITEKADRNAVSLAALGGPSGQYGGSLEAKLRKGDLSLVATGRYYQKSEWTTHYQFFDTAGAVVDNLITIPNKGPGAFVDLSYKKLRLMGAFNRWDNAYFHPDSRTLGLAHWRKDFANAGYSFRPTASWDVDVNVTWTRSRFEVSAAPSIKRDSYDLVAEWTNSVKTSARSRLLFGGLYEYINGQETFYGGPSPSAVSDASRHAGGLYAQMDFMLRDGLSLIGGIQANKIGDTDLGTVPRAGLIWRPFSRVHVKALYSQAFRAPGINELSLKHPKLNGNPDLKPERVGTADLNVSYQGERVQVAAGYFTSRQTQIVVQDRSGVQPIYNNIGEATIRGVEAEGKLYLGNGFYLSGSAIHFTAESGTGSKAITPIAQFGAKGGLSYRWEKGLTIGVFDLYQGDLRPEFNTTLNPSPGAYKLTSLHVDADLKGLLKLKAPLALIGYVDNLFNEQVWLPAWGLKLGSSMPWIEGRSIYVGLELSL